MELEALDREIVACRRCPRLVAWREQVAREKRRAYQDWEYWGRPVPGFGDPRARILAVGLAPGAHGSNRTGRQFTGDASGRFLYPALHRAGLANRPDSASRDDGLVLTDLYISAVCRCAPPGNKPLPEEMSNCQDYLERELELLQPRVIVCLGRVAFDRILRILATRDPALKFAHGAAYKLSTGPQNTPHWILCSYHPSQQNTLTGKLTVPMFDEIWAKAKAFLEAG
jgi:uracil-DNA glycosylase family 4